MQLVTFCKGHVLRGLYPLSVKKGFLTNPAEGTSGNTAEYLFAVAKTLRVMRLTAVVLLACSLHLSARTSSQTIFLSGKNLSLKHVFDEIKKQTGYYVVSNKDLLEKAKPVNVSASNVPLKDFLNIVLKDQQLDYSIEENNILIYYTEPEKKGNAPVITALIDAPPVTGIIRDAEGKPIAAVNIIIKGTSRGTTSDAQGRFGIDASQGDELIISSIGYQTINYKVTSETSLELKLQTAVSSMDEVAVVSTGYQDIKPERFVGSATVVDSVVLHRQVGKSLINRLDGITSGLLFVGKQPGGGANSIQIRGVSTLNTFSDLNGAPAQNPLVILDDFPFTGDVNNINPNDIESLVVLKDAASTSIWGARAGNGVILIKSKKASSGRASLTFNSNIGFLEKPDLNYFPTMATSEYIDVEKYLFDQGYYDIYLQFPQYFSTTPVVRILDKIRTDPSYVTQGFADINALRSLDVRDDMSKHIYRNQVNRQNYLSLTQGNNTINYKLSGGADNNTSGIKGPGKTDRYTFNSVVNFKPLKSLDLSVGTNYSRDKTHGDAIISYPLKSNNGTLYPYAQLIDENGNHLAVPYSLNPEYLETLPKDKLLDWLYRPLDELELSDFTFSTDILRINAGVRLKINSWLSAEGKYLYSSQKYNSQYLNSVNSYYTRDLINKFTDPVSFQRAIPVGGILDIQSNNLIGNNLRGQLNVTKSWNAAHEFTALVAGEISNTKLTSVNDRFYGYDEQTGAYARDMDYKNSYPTFNAFPERILNGSRRSGDKINNFVSLIGNASYTYNKKYTFYVSARRDGNNQIGVNTNNKFRPFWSVGGRWNISSEEFYHSRWLTSINLKASYGYSGNINNSVTALPLFTYGVVNFFGQQNARLQAGNPDLRWEKAGILNIGTDLSLFNGRVGIAFDYWKKRSTDVIINLPVDPTLGILSGYIAKNAADLEGKGFDISINTQNIKGAFQWQSTFNISAAKTVVGRYDENLQNTQDYPVIREGDIYMALYAYKWAGLDPLNGDPRGYIGKDISKDFVAIMNDSMSNQAYIGASIPQVFGNFMNTFTYANFSFSANISYRGNYYFRKPAIHYQQFLNGLPYTSDYNLRWQKPGDELSTNVPSMVYPFDQNRDNFYRLAEINYEKGDHIRLQDIRLSYNWVNKKWSRLPIRNIRLYGYVSNINWMIWKASDSSFDPDYSTAVIPAARSYAFGLNFEF